MSALTFTGIIYKGLKIYKADPIPGEQPCWSRIECTEMLLTQQELYTMVDTNADRISAAMQYRSLPNALRTLVNLLIQQHKDSCSCVEWSCAYAKKYGSFPESPCDSQERERLVVILMSRPQNRGPWPRTPMGDLINWKNCRNSFKREEKGDLSESFSSDLEMDETDGEEASSSEV